MSSEDLNKQLNELKEELFRLRFQLQINQLDNPNKIPETKRNIARVLTVMNEKNS
jgi:large subunit ribosomal protein L29